jgi:hypothetical protein
MTKRDELETERERERESLRLRDSKTCFSFFEVHCDKLGLPKAPTKNFPENNLKPLPIPRTLQKRSQFPKSKIRESKSTK